jgi:hypothetical protein
MIPKPAADKTHLVEVNRPESNDSPRSAARPDERRTAHAEAPQEPSHVQVRIRLAYAKHLDVIIKMLGNRKNAPVDQTILRRELAELVTSGPMDPREVQAIVDQWFRNLCLKPFPLSTIRSINDGLRLDWPKGAVPIVGGNPDIQAVIQAAAVDAYMHILNGGQIQSEVSAKLDHFGNGDNVW